MRHFAITLTPERTFACDGYEAAYSGALNKAAKNLEKKLRHGCQQAAMTITPFRALKGTWFDETLDFRDPEGDALTKRVLGYIAAVETRDRKRRQADEISHYTIVRKILANGLRCHFHRRPPLVAYSRKADGYTGGPTWLSGRAMARTIDILVAAGLLDTRLGQWGGTASNYGIQPRLFSIAQTCGVTKDCLTLRLPPERCGSACKRNPLSGVIGV